MDFPDDLKYTEEHEWALLEGDLVSIGITDFAQHQLGDVVFVDLPAIGERVETGKAFGVVESVKTVSDVYAPLSGEIVEINSELLDAPETVNNSPYDDGWMVRIRPDDAADLDALMDAASYQDFIEEE
ncbi:MAG: glycine cleavage system protein GcvH [Deltaproteobacteria bacterium]|nr:glycine cleavage system protein GcvH [Deltaproteobacteria bacterium]